MVAPGAIAISVETMSSHFTATMSTQFPYNLRRFNVYFQKSTSSFYYVYDQWLCSLFSCFVMMWTWLHSSDCIQTLRQHIKKMPPVLFSTSIVTKPPFYERKWTLQIGLSLLCCGCGQKYVIEAGVRPSPEDTFFYWLVGLQLLHWFCNFRVFYQLFTKFNVFRWQGGEGRKCYVSVSKVLVSHTRWSFIEFLSWFLEPG